jgi:hypothetical protein
MRAYWEATAPNPFAGPERVWQSCAAFEIKTFNNAVRLSCVRSFERQRGKGSAALDWLCSMADAHGVAIEGSIEPVGQTRPRLNKTELRRWYKRHGFTVAKNGDIRREPR